jgi:hypothetical protein
MTDGSGGSTRRQLVAATVALGGIGAAGSTVAALLGAPASQAADRPETDAQLLYGILTVELLVVAVYERVIQTGQLPADAQSVALELLAHERAHAQVVGAELTRLGVAPPQSVTSTREIDTGLAEHHVSLRVDSLHSSSDCLHLLLDVENVVNGVYYAAMSKFTDVALARTAAEIMASEAQHVTVLSELLYPGDFTRSVPYPFAEGSR